MALANVIENEFEVVQYDEPLMFSKRHGNFKVGVQKEANVIDLVVIQDPDQVDDIIENFISSGERIVVLQTPTNSTTSEYRNMISTRLLHRSPLSPMYRRVIVRELDGILYLCRRAFWSAKALPFEYSDELSYETEIGYKVRLQNENVRTVKLPIEHMTELTKEQLQEIKDWEENEQMNAQWEEIAKVIEIAFSK